MVSGRFGDEGCLDYFLAHPRTPGWLCEHTGVRGGIGQDGVRVRGPRVRHAFPGAAEPLHICPPEVFDGPFPILCRIHFRFLRRNLQRRRATPVAERTRKGVLYRVDAKASGNTVTIAGWEAAGSEGGGGRPNVLVGSTWGWTRARRRGHSPKGRRSAASMLWSCWLLPLASSSSPRRAMRTGMADASHRVYRFASQVAPRVAEKFTSTKFPLCSFPRGPLET